jgi:hypothetical protein
MALGIDLLSAAPRPCRESAGFLLGVLPPIVHTLWLAAGGDPYHEANIEASRGGAGTDLRSRQVKVGCGCAVAMRRVRSQDLTATTVTAMCFTEKIAWVVLSLPWRLRPWRRNSRRPTDPKRSTLPCPRTKSWSGCDRAFNGAPSRYPPKHKALARDPARVPRMPTHSAPGRPFAPSLRPLL